MIPRGKWFKGGRGQYFYNVSDVQCPGVVKHGRGQWFVWPSNEPCWGDSKYNPDKHGPLYPNKKAAQAAVKLMYPLTD